MASFPVGIVICLVAGCADPSQVLLSKAHDAVETSLRQTGSGAFDDSATQVFSEEGLVCGSKVDVEAGPDAGYQRYYFSRSLGAAIEGASPDWIPLANSCFAAIVQRAAAAKRELELGEAR